MKVIAIAFLAGAALAQQPPQFNPEVLKWQAEAHARERAINRRAELQLSRSRPAVPTRHSTATLKPVHRNRPK